MSKVKTFAEAETRYGTIINGKWADEAKWMVVQPLPTEISMVMRNNATGQPCSKIYMNRDMIQPLMQVFHTLRIKNLHKELKTFDGCFMIRNVRGSKTALSAHSYGLAIDINAAENPLGKEPILSSALVQIFLDAGFAWGGNFNRKDGMHLSFCWE